MECDIVLVKYTIYMFYYFIFMSVLICQISSPNTFAQSVGAVEYTDCTSAEGEDPLPQRVSLNNLIVRFQ